MITEAKATIVDIATQFGVTQLCRLFSRYIRAYDRRRKSGELVDSRHKTYNKMHNSERMYRHLEKRLNK